MKDAAMPDFFDVNCITAKSGELRHYGIDKLNEGAPKENLCKF